MPYTTLTLTQALADLGRRLNDPDSVFWTDAEKTLYIQEALQTFNGTANFYRSTFSFDLVPDQVWYDISDLAAIPTTLRGQTVTDVDLYTLMQYHLLEPPTGATWTGSLQFNANDMIKAVQHRRDLILSDTGVQITRTVQEAVGYDTTMAETVMDIRRVAWLPNAAQDVYFPVPLWRDDQWEINSFFRNRVPAFGVPETFRVSTQPQLHFSVNTKPIVTGDYEIMNISSGTVLTALNPTVLTIPNDFVWLIKWGALADMLNRESVARDPMRAQYCEMRYRQGLSLIRSSSALLNAEIDYTTLDIDAAQNADNYNPGWQGQPSGVPTSIYTVGLNMIAVSAPPDSNYELDLTVLENAPIPTALDDYLQIGRDDYDPILDYAQHLAAFKQGGAEFTATIPLLNNFIRHVKMYNSKLNERGDFTEIIYEQSRTQNMFFPIMQPIPVEEEM